MFLSILNVRNGVCAYTNTPPEQGSEAERARAHIHTQTIILVGRKKNLPHIKVRLSEFLPLLNDLGTLFTLMYYELSFPSLYKDTEFLMSSLKKYSTFSVLSICIFFH